MNLDTPAPVGTDSSPFARHRDLVLGYNSTAVALQNLVLNCWGGAFYPVVLLKFWGLDEAWRRAAVEMFDHYTRHGESDPAFVSLANELIERRGQNGAQQDSLSG